MARRKKKVKPIPLIPVPPKEALAAGHRIQGIGARLEKFFPLLKVDLRQAELDFPVKDFLGVAFLAFIGYTLLSGTVIFLIGSRLVIDNLPGFTLYTSLFLGGFAFLYIISFPKLIVRRKVRKLEAHLIFALRAILIQIRAGIPLFDALSLVAGGRFKSVSKEFKKAVDKISTGEPEEDALQEIAMNNPSLFFRRSIWQVVMGLKGGGDLSKVLSEIVKAMVEEEKIQIELYGSSLRLLSLLYMMLAVILPALGLTFLIVLSSFPQIRVSEFYYWMLLLMVSVGQFFYLGILKSKRPALMGGD
ncbi:MAG: type II secretion system F family protein [Candidatus Diapherotrites archaeon]|nr:type II secretion system F family protein [Candidatus Diapherotrites archaeon]